MKGSTKCIIFLVVLIILIAGAAILATVFKKIASYEIGIRYNWITKSMGDTVDGEGLYIGPPGFYFIIFPSIYKSIHFDAVQCLNKEGIKISLKVTYQYKVRPKYLHKIVKDFRDYDRYLEVLKYAGESAIHETCSAYITTRFQSERGIFQEDVRQKVRERYETFYTDITDLQVNNISWPPDYESTIRSKERAREDIQVALNERPRHLTEANTEILKTKTHAEVILDKAKTDVRIMELRAKADSEAIIEQYQMEAEAYQEILSAAGLNLTIKGLISYLGTRVISDAKKPVYLALKSPAESSYQTP